MTDTRKLGNEEKRDRAGIRGGKKERESEREGAKMSKLGVGGRRLRS